MRQRAALLLAAAVALAGCSRAKEPRLFELLSPESTGVTFVYRRPAAELDGVGIVLYQASGQDLAPPNSPDELTVMLGAKVGRWSPEDHLLEWVDGRVYRSITGPSFDLASIVRVALSLRGDTR